MKKMTMIAATLLLAACVQAGSMDWAVTGSKAIKDQAGTSVGTGVTVYLVLAGSQATIGAAITAGTFLSSPPTGVLGTGVTTLGTVSTTTTQSAQLTAGTSYNYAVLVFSTPTSYSGAASSTGFYKFSLSKAEVANANGDSTSAITFTSLDFSGASYIPYTVVPEPTSMALLALGVAAIGLRRRFKK